MNTDPKSYNAGRFPFLFESLEPGMKTDCLALSPFKAMAASLGRLSAHVQQAATSAVGYFSGNPDSFLRNTRALPLCASIYSYYPV
jgi:hypothetical protein